MNDLERQAAALLTKLLAVFAQHLPEDQDALIEAHTTITSTRNLIDALQKGRVTVRKTDTWKE